VDHPQPEVAQVSASRTLIPAALGCALALALVATAAGATVPAAGLAAEEAGDWPRAAALYRDALAQPEHAQDAALWARLGEVEARAGRAAAAAEAYARAAALQPHDAAAQREASRAYAVAQQPKPALEHLERAIALRPADEALKLDRVRLANWLGDYALAERTLDELLAKDPQRADISADLGRVRAWQGRLDEADRLFARHLDDFPEDRLAWVDRARIAIWRGDYARAVELLDRHDAKFATPPDRAADAERARALAWTGRWRAAQALNAGLRGADGESYDELFTEAIAARQHHRPAEALPWLERVRALKPDAKETADLARGTWLPLRSRVGLDYSNFEDSEDIGIETLGARAAWRFAGSTWLRAEAQRRDFDAPPDGPFAATGGDGDGSIGERRTLLGIDHAPDAALALGLRLGRSRADGLGSATIGRAALDWRITDDWSLRIDAGRDRIAASPRSLSLDLRQHWLGAGVEWRPDLRWRAQARIERGDYNDDNQDSTFDASAWRAMYRSQSWQWDLGAVALWQDFDHAAPGSGYYAPDGYRRIQAAARGYWHWTDDHGLSVDVATGLQRDGDSDGWKSASDASVEAVFGIFSDWELRLRAAYSDRRQASGNFDGRSIGASLEYRF
jgi:tetratricopeptide (TPR) repeat protein